MPKPLLELLARTHNAGGPLRFARDNEGTLHITWDDLSNQKEPINTVEAAWLDEPDASTVDALAGVLTRDLQARGMRVTVEHAPWSKWDNGREPIRVHAHQHGTSFHAHGRGTNLLTATIHAWLDARTRARAQA